MRRINVIFGILAGLMLYATVWGQSQPLPKPVTPPLPIPESTPKDTARPTPPSGVPAALPATGASTVDSFLDDQTLAVVRFDLVGLDLKGMQDSILQSVDELRKTNQEVDRARSDIQEQLNKTFKKVEDFRGAGAKRVYVIISMADFLQGQPPFVVVPLDKGTDPKPIEDILNSLDQVDEAADQKNAHPPDDLLRASVLRDAVVDAGPRTLERLKTLQPAHTDADRALEAAGKAQVRMAIVAQAGARTSLEQIAPNLPPALGGGPIDPVSKGLQWVSLGVALPPSPSVKVILQGKDADAAKALQQLAEKAIAWAADRKQGPPEALAFTQLVSKLKPVTENDRVVIELKGDDARQLPGVIAASLLNARSMAARQQSMSNLRQLDIGIMMYANDHNGALPKDLGAELQPYLGASAKQIWTDPLRPNQQHPYVYIKLADRQSDVKNSADSIMIYENHTTWDNGINVAFADGHVEWFDNEKQFKEKLDQTKSLNPTAAEMPQ
jgi:prepilin-type processing-associated H-X9-DG protein